jgi:N-acetylglucosaminyldiphosphoundecaprenol N-acetyl-beta-D-mannosaminyltransferase
MKIVISGYFGFGNIGDDAILEAMILGLRRESPSSEITVLSNTPEKTAELYNVKAVNRWKFSAIKRAVKKCDLFISGGGGLIQDVTGMRTVAYYLGLIYLAKFFKKTTVVMGQGFGPINNPLNKIIVRWVLNKVDLIIVRDERSSDDMIAMGIKRPPIHVAGDLTPMLLMLKGEAAKEILRSEGIEVGKKPLIGISIRHPSKKLSKVNASAYYKTIAASADRIIEDFGAKLVFIPFHYPTDIIESAKIINLMKNPVNMILREYSPVEVLSIISQMDLFIGMRLHSLIFSAMASVPMVGIAYDPKVKTFLKLIDQKWIDIADIFTGSLAPLIKDVWSKRAAAKKALEPWSKDLYIKAKLNFNILSGFLSSINVRDILGIKFDNLKMAEIVEKIDSFIRSKTPHLVVTPNPEIIVSSQSDEDLREIINSASLRLADGIGIIWASRILKRPIKERVTGIDLTLELANLAQKNEYRIFLLGSKSGVAEGAAEFLAQKFPKIQIVGTYHGYFEGHEEDKLIENIKSLKPEILLIGLGSPRQEKWAAANLDSFGVPVCLTIGGSMDVLSGKAKRAPVWMRRVGLEWLYRLLKEPWRFRRQLSLIRFVLLVIFTKLFPGKRR